MCVIFSDAFRSVEENEGTGRLHKQAGKVTLECKAKTSMSSPLPFNTTATLTTAPSEYGVGCKVYMTVNRMYHVTQQTLKK